MHLYHRYLSRSVFNDNFILKANIILINFYSYVYILFDLVSGFEYHEEGVLLPA